MSIRMILNIVYQTCGFFGQSHSAGAAVFRSHLAGGTKPGFTMALSFPKSEAAKLPVCQSLIGNGPL
jgi:hypothetical protein